MSTWGVPIAVFVLTCGLSSAVADAGSMCNSGKIGGTRLENATANGSAKFLEAASDAFLAFKAVEDRLPKAPDLAKRSASTLEVVITAYKKALGLTDDLARADVTLRDGPFQKKLSPSPTAALRWQVYMKVARESGNPASDLISVCLDGATRLQPMMKNVTSDMPASSLRRIEEEWSVTLSNGIIVSDMFDQ